MTDTDTSRGRIHSLNISKGGVPKRTIERAPVTRLGLVGDKHNNTRLHGGPERAVCLYSVELMRRLNAERHNIAPGSRGENVTLEGVDTTALEPGDVLRLGPEVVLQISAYTTPCKKIAHNFAGGDYSRLSAKLHPGESRLYARVLAEGSLAVGDPVTTIGA